MKRSIFLFFFVCIVSPLFFSGSALGASKDQSTLPALHVQGNHIVDDNGNTVVLRGASRWSLEFSCGDGHFNVSDFLAMKSWGMNTVRLPLNENYFLFPSLCQNQYMNTFQTAIAHAESQGMYVILDLHWVSPYDDTGRGGLFPLTDSKAKGVWQQLAQTYKNDNHIIFEPFNESHDISCDTWKNGGEVTSKSGTTNIGETGGTYSGVGIQELISIIRNEGAQNMIIAGPTQGGDLTCLKTDPLQDNNLVYRVHLYNFNTSVSRWPAQFEWLESKAPIIAGEFDITDPDLALAIINHFESIQTGYLAWAWQGCTYMTADCNGTPTDQWKAIHDTMLAASQKATQPSNPCTAMPTILGTATLTVSVNTTANYIIWSRIMVPSPNAGYYLQIDTHCPEKITSNHANTWQWVKGSRNTLTKGTHTLHLIGTDRGVKVDKVIMTTNPNCVPTNRGDNCV